MRRQSQKGIRGLQTTEVEMTAFPGRFFSFGLMAFPDFFAILAFASGKEIQQAKSLTINNKK